MNYADIKRVDVANGPGVRVSLFVSGCTHRCPGCFNPEAWDFAFGAPFGAERDIQALLERDSLVMTKRSKKAKSGFTQVDLIPLVARASVEERRDTIALDLVLREVSDVN